MKIFNKRIAFGCSFVLVFVTLGGNYVWAQQAAATAASDPAKPVVEVASRESASAQPSATAKSRLQIGPGDLLNVSVFGVPDLTQAVRVSDLGDTTFQLIGALHLSGLTTDQAGSLIAQKFKDGNFLLNPQVSVFIAEYSTQGVSILGEVQKPGVYNVLGDRSLLDIISEAGGLTPAAGPEVMVKHLDGKTASFKLTKNAQASLDSDVALLPGDKVIVSRAGIIYVLGDVSKPGGFLMENDGKISLLEAIAMAGGPNQTASTNHARLIRKSATGYTETSLQIKNILQGNSGDVQLQSEDIIYVPTNVAKAAVYRTTPSLLSAATSAAIYRTIP